MVVRIKSEVSKKIKTLQHCGRQIRDMPFFPERMPCAYQHGVLSEQFQQLCRREKGAFGFVQLQTMIQLQNSLHGSNAQHMAALGDVGLHTGKYFQSVKHICIPLAGSLCGNIAVKQLKLLRVEMLCQTDGIQPRAFCFHGFFAAEGRNAANSRSGINHPAGDIQAFHLSSAHRQFAWKNPKICGQFMALMLYFFEIIVSL